MKPPKLAKPLVFAWDTYNRDKIKLKHNIHYQEAEEVFQNKPLHLAYDEKHSSQEQRYSALGRTNKGKLLTLVFTVRASIIRIISARSMSRKERVLYAQTKN